MNYTVISNSSLKGVQQSVRAAALQDFEFFANTVLCSRLSEELCSAAQEAIELGETCYLRHNSPRSLATALYFYLSACGYVLLTEFRPVPQSELLSWLELEKNVEGSIAVSLHIHSDGVSLSWL